jgi:hypothetical protein
MAMPPSPGFTLGVADMGDLEALGVAVDLLLDEGVVDDIAGRGMIAPSAGPALIRQLVALAVLLDQAAGLKNRASTGTGKALLRREPPDQRREVD